MLQCKNRMQQRVPGRHPVNTAIRLLLANKIQDAAHCSETIRFGRSLICPQKNFCEGHRIVGKKSSPVQDDIEHYISSYFLDRLQADRFKTEERKDPIAIVGSGPAGLTVAFILAIHGYQITIFESKDRIGGVMQYGIPDFRLPKSIIDKLHKALLRLGVKIRPNMLIGPVITLDDLLQDCYMAVFIGTGVWNPKPLRLPGETMGHVHYAINYLKNPDGATWATGWR